MIIFRNQQENEFRHKTCSVLHTVAELRLVKDYEELASKRYTAGIASTYISMPQSHYTHKIIPVSFHMKEENPHLYCGAWFHMEIYITPGYPFKPPSVQVKNQVLHPNIDIDTGEVFIRSLNPEFWKPVMTINSVLFSIEMVLYEPDLEFIPNNPINWKMREMLISSPLEFQEEVVKSLEGVEINEYYFEKNYGKSLEKKRKKKSIERELKKMSISE